MKEEWYVESEINGFATIDILEDRSCSTGSFDILVMIFWKIVYVQQEVIFFIAHLHQHFEWDHLYHNSPPPPSVVLPTQLEIDHDNRNLWAGDGEDDEDEEEESEQVVELVLVDGGEDEEELDEASTKGEDAGHQGANSRMHVPYLQQPKYKTEEKIIIWKCLLFANPNCFVPGWAPDVGSGWSVQDAHMAASCIKVWLVFTRTVCPCHL